MGHKIYTKFVRWQVVMLDMRLLHYVLMSRILEHKILFDVMKETASGGGALT